MFVVTGNYSNCSRKREQGLRRRRLGPFGGGRAWKDNRRFPRLLLRGPAVLLEEQATAVPLQWWLL